MSATNYKQLYNDFLQSQLDDKEHNAMTILNLTPCWPSETLYKGSISSQTAMNFIVEILKEEDVETTFESFITLFTRCEKPKDVLDMLESVNLSNSTAYVVFEQLTTIYVQVGCIVDRLEMFAIDKEPWVLSFLATVCQTALTIHLIHTVVDDTSCLLQVHLIREYIAMLVTFLPCDDGDIQTIYKSICDLDLVGPKISTIGTIGEEIGPSLVLVVARDDYCRYTKMHQLLTANRCSSEYGKLLWKPFYSFSAPPIVYNLLEKVSAIPICIDMENAERDDSCQICFDGINNVRFDNCQHTMCSQCVYTLLRKAHSLTCPFCRSEVTDLKEFDPDEI